MLAIRRASTAGGHGVATTGQGSAHPWRSSAPAPRLPRAPPGHRDKCAPPWVSTIAQELEVSSCGACDAGLAAGSPMSWRCSFGSVAHVEQHLAHHPYIAELHQCGEADGGGEPPVT